MMRQTALALAAALLPCAAAAQPSPLSYRSPCSFTYADGAAYPVASHVCDYLNTKGSGWSAQFSKQSFSEQQEFLKKNAAAADQALARLNQGKQKLLAETQVSPSGLSLSQLRQKQDLLAQQEQELSAPFASNRSAYVGDLEQRKQELAAAVQKQDNTLAAREHAETNKAAADFDRSGTAASGLRGGAESMDGGGDGAAAGRRFFENDGRSGAGAGQGSGSGAAQLDGAAAGNLTGQVRTRYDEDHFSDDSSLMDEKSKQPGGAQPGDTRVVAWARRQEADFDADGVHKLEAADWASDQADKSKAEQDAKASQEWQNGHPFSAAWEKAKGYGDYAGYKTGEYSLKGSALFVDGVGETGCAAVRGDPEARKRIEVGAAEGAMVVASGGGAGVVGIGMAGASGYFGSGSAIDTARSKTAGQAAWNGTMTALAVVPGAGAVKAEAKAVEGAPAAMAEAAKPGLFSSMKSILGNETGAVGPGVGDLIKEQQAAKTLRTAEAKIAQSDSVEGAARDITKGMSPEKVEQTAGQFERHADALEAAGKSSQAQAYRNTAQAMRAQQEAGSAADAAQETAAQTSRTTAGAASQTGRRAAQAAADETTPQTAARAEYDRIVAKVGKDPQAIKADMSRSIANMDQKADAIWEQQKGLSRSSSEFKTLDAQRQALLQRRAAMQQLYKYNGAASGFSEGVLPPSALIQH